MNIYPDLTEIKKQFYIPENSLVKADCLEAMPFIERQSVDLILADLPYESTNCVWDKLIPLDKLWIEYKRIIKPNGAIVLFAQTPFDKVLGCSNLDWLKYEWIWEKTHATGQLNAKIMPMKAHENILVFYNKTPTYNPQKTQGHEPAHTFNKKADIQNKGNVYNKVTKDVIGGGQTDRYPRSVLLFPTDKQKNKNNGTLFDTQKPIALINYFIRTYSNEGDLVVDNCFGSNTTGLGCKMLNRNYIGIEMFTKQFNLGIKRISELLI